MSHVRYRFVDMPFTSFCELPEDDHLTFVPAVMLVYHPSLEFQLSFIGSVLLLNIANHTLREFADMLLHGEAWRNGRAAHQLYEERFPHRQTPSHSLFAKVYQRASKRVHSPAAGPTVVIHASAVPPVRRSCTPCSGRG